MHTEEWKDIPGWEGYYQVSNKGRVKSLDRDSFYTLNGRLIKRPVYGRILKPWTTTHGYKMIALHGDGDRKKIHVHQLVLLAFVGPAPLNHQSCHNDGNPKNNNLENLRWDTVVNNMKDKKKHGTHLCGEMIGNAKLTESDVRDIKRRLQQGEKQSDIANSYNITPANITMIKNGNSWRHV